MVDENRVYTVKQAVEILSISRQRLYDEINAGRIDSILRRRRRLFSGRQLIDYVRLLESGL